VEGPGVDNCEAAVGVAAAGVVAEVEAVAGVDSLAVLEKEVLVERVWDRCGVKTMSSGLWPDRDLVLVGRESLVRAGEEGAAEEAAMAVVYVLLKFQRLTFSGKGAAFSCGRQEGQARVEVCERERGGEEQKQRVQRERGEREKAQ